MSKWIKKDDQVVVIAGNEKGRHGKVLMRRANKVVVEGLNMRTKHIKRSQTNPEGGTVKIEMPIHISNVQFCDEDGNSFKPSINFTAEGEKQLLLKRKGSDDKVLRTIKAAKKGTE